MGKCQISVMGVICTLVAILSVSILVGLWTYQFLKTPKETRSQGASWKSLDVSASLTHYSYNVTLWLELNSDDNDTFTGSSSLVFRCVKSTNLILMCSKKLNLTSQPVLTALGGSIAPTILSTQLMDSRQELVMSLKDSLMAGETYELHMEYTGEFSDIISDMFSSKSDKETVKKIVAENPCSIFPSFKLKRNAEYQVMSTS